MEIQERKHYFVAGGLKIHWGFTLLPEDFDAITLFGHVFSNMDKDTLGEYLQTGGGKVLVNHERIHTLQAGSFATRYLAFYVLYLWYWIVGLFKYGAKNNASYYQIPFEREAYKNQSNFAYNETSWREYID